MSLTDEIQTAIKSNNATIGYNESASYIKTDTPKMIIVANNLPVSMKDELEHNAKVSKSKFEIFEGTSRELGVVCGKPYPVTTLVIRK